MLFLKVGRTDFRSIQESENTKLRVLYLNDRNLSGVAPDILVEAVARLERVDLSDTDLTTDQLTGIFRLLADRMSIKLKWISIRGNNRINEVTDRLRKKAVKNHMVEFKI